MGLERFTSGSPDEPIKKRGLERFMDGSPDDPVNAAEKPAEKYRTDINAERRAFEDAGGGVLPMIGKGFVGLKGLLDIGALALERSVTGDTKDTVPILRETLDNLNSGRSDPIGQHIAQSYDAGGAGAVFDTLKDNPQGVVNFLAEMLPGAIAGGGAGGGAAKLTADAAVKRLAPGLIKRLAPRAAAGAGANSGATFVGGLTPNTASAYKENRGDLEKAVSTGLKQTGVESAVAAPFGAVLPFGRGVKVNAGKALAVSPVDEVAQTVAGNASIGKDTSGGEMIASALLGGVSAPVDIGTSVWAAKQGNQAIADEAVPQAPIPQAAPQQPNQVVAALDKIIAASTQPKSDIAPQEQVPQAPPIAQTESAPAVPELPPALAEAISAAVEPVAQPEAVTRPNIDPINQPLPEPAVSREALPASAEAIAQPAQQPLETDGVRPLVENLIRRRRIANEMGKARILDNALSLGRDLLAGKPVNPGRFRNAANAFKDGDKPLYEALIALHEKAKAPRPQVVEETPKPPRQQKSALTATDPDLYSEAARRAFLQILKKNGGISVDDAADITGESAIRTARMSPGLFKRGAPGIDLVARQLWETGYLSNEEYNSVDGGVQRARDLVGMALNKEPVLSMEQQERLAELERMAEEQANAEGEAEEIDALDLTQAEFESLFDGLPMNDQVDAQNLDQQRNYENDSRSLAESERNSGEIPTSEAGSDTQSSEGAQGRAAVQGSVPEGQQQNSDTGRNATVQRPDEGFSLAQQTERDLAEREAALNKREAEQNARERAALDKEKADRARDDFTLTGSDRAADANARQDDLLSNTINPEKIDSSSLDSETSRTSFERYAALGNEPVVWGRVKSDALKITGLSDDIRVEIGKQMPPNVPMRFDLNRRVIEVNRSLGITHADAVQYMVEELLHSIDALNGTHTLSASSARLDLETGDIALEVKQHFAEGGKYSVFFSYPLDSKYDFSDDRIKAELFARLGALYFGEPDLMRQVLPLTYGAFDGIFQVRINPVTREVSRSIRGVAGRTTQARGESGPDRTSIRGDGKGSGNGDSTELGRLRDAISEAFGANRRGQRVDLNRLETRVITADQTVPQETPGKSQNSKWRDSLGRVQFAPGVAAKNAGKGFIKWSMGKTELTQKLYDSFKLAPPKLQVEIRKMKAAQQKALDAASDVAKAANSMTGAERALVSDVIENMVKSGVIPPQNIVQMADRIRNVMDAQTDELVALGMLGKDSAQRWRGQYLPRFYNRKGDPALDTVSKKLFGSAVPLRGMGGNSLKARGLFHTVQISDVESYEALGWEVRDPLWENKQGKLELKNPDQYMKDLDTVEMWRDFTPAERESMGENRDAVFRFAMGYTAMQNDIALGKLFDGIAKNSEWTRPRAEIGYTHIPDTVIPDTGGVKRYGNLAGLYVRDDIFAHVTQYEESSELLKMYRKGMGLWKMGKVPMNPVSHTNNVVSNLTMAHMAGVSYWDAHKYIAAIRDFANGALMLDEAKDIGLLTGDITRAELIQEMPEEIKKMMEAQESSVKKSARTVYDIGTFFLRKPLLKAYRFEDDFFKYLIYRDARNQGLKPEEAMLYATQYIFNYDDLPRGARVIRDTAIPFFSYTYKAIPALLHTATHYPWRFMAPSVIVGGYSLAVYSAYAALAGAGDDDELKKMLDAKAEDQKKLAPWDQGKSAFLTDKTIRTGAIDDRTGNPVFLNIYRLLPGGDLLDTGHGDSTTLPAPLMPSNPILGMLAAMLPQINKDIFTGKALVDENDTGVEVAKKRTGYMLKTLSPAVAPTGYHFDKLSNALADTLDATLNVPFTDIEYTGIGKDGQPVQAKYAIPQTLGIKIGPVDMGRNQMFDEIKNNAQARSIVKEIRAAAFQLERGTITQRAFDKIEKDGREKLQRIDAK